MSFCPKCPDSMLRAARSSKDIKKKVLKCMTCGFETDLDPKTAAVSQGDRAMKSKAKAALVLDGNTQPNPNMVVPAICPKCKHDKAATWQVQTRGGDEPSTHFFRCVKCNHTWREY